MRRSRRRQTKNVISLSFLDMVSAGFGASFFLFIIFASMPVTTSAGLGGSTDYIDVEVSWDHPEYLLELAMKNDDLPWVRIGGNSISTSRTTGEISIDGLPYKRSYFKNLFGIGTSYSGSNSLLDSTPDKVSRSMYFRVVGPCTGNWQFSLQSLNRFKSQGWTNDSLDGQISYKIRILFPTMRDIDDAYLSSGTLSSKASTEFFLKEKEHKFSSLKFTQNGSATGTNLPYQARTAQDGICKS